MHQLFCGPGLMWRR